MWKILMLLSVLYGGFCGIAHACESNQIDVNGDGTQCETTKFTITTIELEPDTEFKFYMSAMGTFYVDWGDGTVDTIARTDTNSARYNHTYTTGGSKTIRFGGVATMYSDNGSSAIRFGGQTSDLTTPSLLMEINGSLGQIFPTIEQGQQKYQQPIFLNLCWNCINLTSISEDLFEGITGDAINMFAGSFQDCRALRFIPDGLFNGIYGGKKGMFLAAFYDCASLTSIPENLFNGININAEVMFNGTFMNCSRLKGFIPKNLFSGLIASGSPISSDMMASIFRNTALATTCPIGTSQYITGYEEYWGGKVACEPHTHICDTGTYFPTTTDGCVECPENNYCPGGTYTYNGTNLGITQCPAGLYSPAGMWEATQCGRILHVGDGFVYLRATKKTSPSLHLDLNHDGVADYFGNMTTFDVPMSRETSRKLKVRYNNTTYSIYDDSVDLSLYEN